MIVAAAVVAVMIGEWIAVRRLDRWTEAEEVEDLEAAAAEITTSTEVATTLAVVAEVTEIATTTEDVPTEAAAAGALHSPLLLTTTT